jgi:hypothetical protein
MFYWKTKQIEVSVSIFVLMKLKLVWILSFVYILVMQTPYTIACGAYEPKLLKLFYVMIH